ncbi:hypothetical protein [Streptomyces sp. NPDC003077]|uniref:hypothetical protein n=1 Tax=Streptomyces sp. NPDC003077 TaxID=3154443 RepID=UPI0033AC7618
MGRHQDDTGRTDDARPAGRAPRTGERHHSPAERALTSDHRWPGDLKSALACSGALLGLLLLCDGGLGHLTVPRAGMWGGLAVLLFLVLLPPRITAGEGWLAARGLLGERRVRTDCLVTVHRLDGVAQRLVLRDAYGARVELDPRVLTANPRLWHLLDKGARASRDRGLLLHGVVTLRELSRRVDNETAHQMFKLSGLI